jgi:MerR family Zn(II)-responsive transcriptional regulator of zntA
VEFIKRAKSVGFTLAEITELLSIRVDPGSHTCADVKQLANAKLQQIRQKIDELQQMHEALARISAICCGGEEAATHCTILNALDATQEETA